MSKDYYKILGVAEFDTLENIKHAYRRLARKWHPDVAGNSVEALNRFKEINEAYEILSDVEKKSEYDRARRFYNYAKEGSASKQETKGHATKPESDIKNHRFNWEEFLWRKNRAESYKKEEDIVPKRGDDIYTDVEITVLEALSGTTKVINMLQTQPCSKCAGRKFINGTICPNCHGKGETSVFKKFNVKIPAGIKNKSKIRLAGEGSKGKNGGKNGDLYITIHVKEENVYKTEGLNVFKTIPITPYEAVLGAEINVQGLSGSLYVKIPAGTENGQRIRLAKCGIVQNDKIGDMILTVEIRIPKNLTREEIDLYKKLEEIASTNSREQMF